MLTLDSGFRETARRFPDCIAMRYYQDDMWENITYSELNTAVNTIAHGLVDLGIIKDSHVAIMCENRPEWVVSYLAIVTTGAVAIPIDALLGEIETEHILNHSGAETIICSMRCYDVIGRILSEIRKLHNIVILDRNITVRREHKGEGRGKDLIDNGKKHNNHKNFMSYDDLREAGNRRLGQGEVEFTEKTVEDLSSIIYTSGTTGLPKGVMLTHKNFMSNIDSISHLIQVDERDNFILMLPLHHAFPFTICLALPIVIGASISFVDILSHDRNRLIMECSPTFMIGVPLLYSKICKGILSQIEKSTLKTLLYKYGGKKIIGRALKKKLGGKLRIMNSGAAPMDPSVIQFYVSLGIEFIEGYGLTETAPVVSCNPPGAIKIASVGPPLKNIEVKIVNPDNEGTGEIAVKGDNVMIGYYKNPEQTERVLKNGWFYTGDLGCIDEDGYIYITGRAKDVIVTSGGKNVYPEVVENVIKTIRFIAESIVLGYKTKGIVGEEVGVLIYPDYEALIAYAEKEGIAFTEPMNVVQLTEDAKDELIEKLRPLLESEVRSGMGKLAPYQRVSRIAIERDEFIKTSTRKIKRFLYKGRLDIVDIG